MPKKKRKASDDAMSPQQIAQTNRDNIDYQMQQAPMLKFDDIMSNSNEMMGGMFEQALEPFMNFVERGEATMDSNPMLPPTDGRQNTGPAPQPAPQPQMSAYDMRINELMSGKGMTRAEAVENQRGALERGTDFNNDGAISNDEWARHLGADYDSSGGVSNPEWAKYQAAQQPNPQQPNPQQDLQTGGGLGVAPPTPRDRTYGTTMPAPGTQPGQQYQGMFGGGRYQAPQIQVPQAQAVQQQQPERAPMVNPRRRASFIGGRR